MNRTVKRLRVWSLIYGAVAALCLFAAYGIAALAQEPEAAATTTDGGLSVSGIFGEIFQSDTELLFAMMVPGLIVYALGVIIQPGWSSKVKQAVTYAVCFVVAAAFIFFKGDTAVLSWDGAPRLFIVIAAIARGYYQMYKGPITDVENSVLARRV